MRHSEADTDVKERVQVSAKLPNPLSLPVIPHLVILEGALSVEWTSHSLELHLGLSSDELDPKV